MSLWGNNNQSVTVTNTTTRETSSGAPIGAAANARWGRDNTSIVVTASNVNFGNTSSGSKASVDLAFFQNDTPNAFLNGMAVGIYGISSNQMSSNTLSGSHAGWTLVHQGTGGRAGRVWSETLVAMHSVADVVSISNGLRSSLGDNILFSDGSYAITTS